MCCLSHELTKDADVHENGQDDVNNKGSPLRHSCLVFSFLFCFSSCSATTKAQNSSLWHNTQKRRSLKKVFLYHAVVIDEVDQGHVEGPKVNRLEKLG